MSEKGSTVTETRTRASVADWLRHLEASTADQLWTGPRPLREDENDRLVGRTDDVREVAKWLRLTRLIHLTGVSGVGKSSMLMAGLIPQLRQAGYTVAYCRKWDLGDDNFLDHVAHALYDSLQHDPVRGTGTGRFHDDKDILWDLDALNGTAVVILDQFEEYLRQHGQSAKEAFETLIALHEHLSIRIILSYRSEYSYLAEDIDRDPRVISPRSIKLGPIPNEAALELITSPKPPAGGDPVWDPSSVIEGSAAREIHRIWSSAPPFRDGTGAVGPLHLQAFLFVLDSYRNGRPITTELVAEYRRRALANHREALRNDDAQAEAMMRFALEESVSVRLAQAEAAADLAGMDDPAIVGTSAILAQIVPHLSSGGYKVSIQVDDLVDKVLVDELDQLRGDLEEQLEADPAGVDPAEREADDLAAGLAAALVLTLTNDLFDGNAGNDGEHLSLTRMESLRDALGRRADLPPFDWWARTMLGREDDRYGSSGLMLGFSPLHVLIEQLRRFAWALAWLAHLDIATVGGGGEEAATIRLVHDGFGPALRTWAERFEEGNATAALYSIATQPGLSHDWAPLDSDEEQWRNRYVAVLSGEPGAPKFHFNLGFRGNVIIGAQLRNVVFVNCEFTGTVFIRCRFTRVTFLNCRLDGALFDRCIIGDGGGNEAPAAPLPRESIATSSELDEFARPIVYSVADPEGMAGLMALYREQGEENVTDVLAQPPGRPARPATAREAAAAAPWHLESVAGLVIHGSRVAAVILRALEFEGERVLFRRVRGSGIDFGEMSGFAAIDIQRSLIRHLTMTSAKDASDRPLGCTVDLRVEDTVASQWWLGEGVDGQADVSGTQLGQIWIESPDLELHVDATCRSTDVMSSAVIAGQRLPALDAAQALPAADPAELELFRRATSAMDYRQRPETAAGDS